MIISTSRGLRFSLLVTLAALISACATPVRETTPCTIQQQHARCVAVPVHDDEHEDEAKALTPAPEGYGYLYLTRPYSQQRSVKAKLFVNDVFLAELGPMSFARIKMPQGSYRIKVTAEKTEDVSISVDMKKEAFVEYQIAEHFFSTEPSIKLVSKERARERVPFFSDQNSLQDRNNLVRF
ncbi:DUF2846 domain-containing protein [Herbaspirillum huttiense]|uniref:DUF2846 domain-containing protein n=1 Tax=Herbaspirillum huttiense TaxID=863372 RepID=UPI0012FF4729|nr:DUF2846 domain-containing protein [Herbaspirillum huttiense]